ncbi:MAG: response regulator [Eubacteriales bacterium]
MRILIAEDDLASRRFIGEFFSDYGTCDYTVDGMETLDAFLLAWDEGEPYNLICLDIMMPKVDGLKALKVIRDIEEERGILGQDKVKIIMITALMDTNDVQEAFDTGCEAYATKPVDTNKLEKVMEEFGLVD